MVYPEGDGDVVRLFDCTSDNISVHLQNIYDTDELKKEATTEKISVVRREGNRDVNRTLQFYNLDAIISVGSRCERNFINSLLNHKKFRV